MQYEVTTPTEYLEALEKDWRLDKIQELRAIIKSSASDFEEIINYKMLGYKDERGVAFHLNAQKNYVSFYVGDAEKVDQTGELLKGIDVGKGCIRFKKSVSIADTRIGEFIEKAVGLWKAGEDIDC